MDHKEWLATIGRKGGSARSEAKARASRLNGSRGFTAARPDTQAAWVPKPVRFSRAESAPLLKPSGKLV